MNKENKYCVYFHINPVKKEVFYVGIGKCKRANDKGSRNRFWHNIVNKYGYNIVIIESDLTKEFAIEREQYYIKLFGRRDLGLGSLVNMTDGGEGNRNIVFSETTKKIWSEQRKGNKNPNYGKRLSEEHKEKMRIAKIGHPAPMLGKRHSQKSILKNRLAHLGQKPWNKGIPRTVEERQKIRIARWGKIQSNG